MTKKRAQAKLIFNPNAGKKRSMVSLKNPVTLEEIKDLLTQYQINADYFPTKGPGDGRKLAKEATKEGYKMVLVAGGDGTVAEVASGLIGSKLPLGIIPVGSVMNVARMLSIPFDIEKAVALIKINNVRKIDVGEICLLNGEKLTKPSYFFEEAGIGLEAQLHYYLTGIFERQEKNHLKVIKTLFDFYGHRAKITLDKKVIETRATVITISNGPLSWAALPTAKKAKLDDHRLTVKLYRMSKLEITRYLLGLILRDKSYSPKIETFQSKMVKIETRVDRLIHADARVFGSTPAEFKLIPEALNVITGFPRTPSKAAFETFIEP